jgi:hypothetical protein
MTQGDWIALGACATGVMAFATFLLAWQSRSLSKETKRLADASLASVKVSQDLVLADQQLVEASREGAIATRELAIEAQRDRELMCRPFLRVTPLGDLEVAHGRLTPPFVVRNIGGGPALGLRIFTWPDQTSTAWYRSVSVDIGVGETQTFQSDMFLSMPSLPEYSWFGYGADPANRLSQGTVVLFWRDILGWRYRLPVIPFPVAESVGVVAEGLIDLRLPDAERRRPTQGTADWDTTIRIFPTTE